MDALCALGCVVGLVILAAVVVLAYAIAVASGRDDMRMGRK